MKKITLFVAALCATTMAFAGTITIDESNVTWGTSYANCPSTLTISGQTFDVVNLVNAKLNGDSVLQFSKLDADKSRAAGYIANKNSLDLVSIVLTKAGSYQNLTIYAGATAADLTKVDLVESGSTYTATMPDGAKFFKVINESSYAAQCTSIAINVEGEIGGDDTGDATELTVNYAGITYYEELSGEGAHNFSVDFMYYNATEDSVHAPYISFDIYSASATAIAGSYSITASTIGTEYSYAMLTDAELIDEDAEGVTMTTATLTLTYAPANDTYKAVAAFTASDGKKYTINAEVPFAVFKALDTDGDDYYDDYEDYTLYENTTAIRDIEVMSDVYARDGRIYAEEGAHIYTILGLDVTNMNGQLNGVYVVKNGNKIAKVVVR